MTLLLNLDFVMLAKVRWAARKFEAFPEANEDECRSRFSFCSTRVSCSVVLKNQNKATHGNT